MAKQFLDKAGVLAFWNKTKDYTDKKTFNGVYNNDNNETTKCYYHITTLRTTNDASNHSAFLLKGICGGWADQNLIDIAISSRDGLKVRGTKQIYNLNSNDSAWVEVYKQSDNTFKIYIVATGYNCFHFVSQFKGEVYNNQFYPTLSNKTTSPTGSLVWSLLTDTSLTDLKSSNSDDGSLKLYRQLVTLRSGGSGQTTWGFIIFTTEKTLITSETIFRNMYFNMKIVSAYCQMYDNTLPITNDSGLLKITYDTDSLCFYCDYPSQINGMMLYEFRFENAEWI